MGKSVLVSVSGIQLTNGVEYDPIEVLSRGERIDKDGNIYIHYDEVEQEDTNETDGKIVQNQIQICGDRVSLLKQGESGTHMLFKEGESTISYYTTPYGNLELTLFTKKMNMNINEQLLEVEVFYDLMIAGSKVSEHQVRISAKSSG